MPALLLPRRVFLKFLGFTLALAGGFGKIPQALAADLPEVKDFNHPTFDVFLAYTRIILNRPDYPAEQAKAFFKIFMEEPWGPTHISGAYGKLREALLAHKGDKPLRVWDAMKDFTKGEKWFTEHALTTYYLGNYYHESRPPFRVSREGAMLYRIIPGYSTPYVTGTGFGAWARPPKDKA
jgi:hypothetical protein